MCELGREVDLPQEAIRAQCFGELRPHDLDRDLALVPEIADTRLRALVVAPYPPDPSPICLQRRTVFRGSQTEGKQLVLRKDLDAWLPVSSFLVRARMAGCGA